MSDHYILVDHEPKEAELLEWAFWYETADRIVEQTTVGDVRVSTIFLGLDYSFGNGPPMFFETMVFGGTLDLKMRRYTTWDEAVAGHAAAVARVMAEEKHGN